MADTLMKPSLSEMSAAELLKLQRDTRKQLSAAKKDSFRGVTESNLASPKDPLVQQLAREMLREMHDSDEMSFEEIGGLYGVTRERVRQVYNALCFG